MPPRKNPLPPEPISPLTTGLILALYQELVEAIDHLQNLDSPSPEVLETIIRSKFILNQAQEAIAKLINPD